MEKLTIEINEGAIKEIRSCYGKADPETVRNVVEDILDRYVNVEHFDTKLRIEDKDF